MKRGFAVAVLAMLLAVPMLACDDDGPSPNLTPGTGTLGGVLLATPDLTGSWRADGTITANSCGTIGSSLVDARILEIVGGGAALDIDLFNTCGTLIGNATGEVNPSSVFTATSTSSLTLSGTCSLELQETITGTVNDLQDLITGSTTLLVQPDNSPTNNCGAGYPCQIDSTFVAARCPPADCTILTCP